ncbi:SRPBCC family protein [Flaviaesturariibacter amylovorans]|uniref:Cell division protein n=1 Tax=Flaviaesturariibacter amylovorans TaxID=1084520 RepID=A0ABP8GJF2_9BACT
MSLLLLETRIQAPVDLCFDLARSVEVHLESTSHTHERAVSGRLRGLCELGDRITWRARHFGIYQHLTVAITEMRPYAHFQDRMVEGAFAGFIHDHFFEAAGGTTLMRDRFDYSAPYGLLGTFAEWAFLDRYMHRLLERRNSVIRQLAEAGWQPPGRDRYTAGGPPQP